LLSLPSSGAERALTATVDDGDGDGDGDGLIMMQV
jgi:hypothetical protein